MMTEDDKQTMTIRDFSGLGTKRPLLQIKSLLFFIQKVRTVLAESEIRLWNSFLNKQEGFDLGADMVSESID